MATKRILIIGPETTALYSIAKRTLLPYGFELFFAAGHMDGMKSVYTNNPHLLLLELPLGSTTALLRELALVDVTIPAILVLGRDTTQIGIDLLRLGARDYITYPCTPNDLLSVVRSVLKREAQTIEYRQLVNDLEKANRELERRLRDFEMLFKIGHSIGTVLDWDAVLNRVTEAAVYITGAEEGYLLLLDESSGELQLRAAQNLGENQAEGFKIKVMDSIAGAVVRSGKPIMLSGGSTQNLKVKTGLMVKSLLNVPLQSREQVIGILGVDNQFSERGFNSEHLRQLKHLANIAVTALENARQYTEMHNELTRRVKEFAILQAITDQLGAISDFEVGAQLALSLMLKATNAEVGVLAWGRNRQKQPHKFVSQGILGHQLFPRDSNDVQKQWWRAEPLTQVIVSGEPMLNNNLGVDDASPVVNRAARSQLIVPLKRGKTTVGAIDLESTVAQAFSPEDMYFVTSIADQVAIALEMVLWQERARVDRKQFALLMDTVDNAVWLVDANLNLVSQNQAASEMIGVSSYEALGQSVYKLIPSGNGSPHKICRLFQQAVEQQRPVSFSHSTLPVPRHSKPLLVDGRVVPIVQQEETIGAIGAFWSARPRRESRYLEVEFANMASHLFRTPLSFIQTSIDLLMDSNLEVEEQQSMLERMREQGKYLAQSANELLKMLRLETEGIDIHMTSFAIVPLVERVLELVQHEDPRYVFELTAAEPLPLVYADATKTELILLNLLLNSVKRCDKGCHIAVDITAQQNEMIVSVRDDGRAIPKPLQRRVFEKFYPIDADGGKMPATYYLGLFTTRQFVELQGGRIWVESNPGSGSQFSFSLPLWEGN